MLDCILKFLDLVIKSTIVVGIITLLCVYLRIQWLDRKIEYLHKTFEKARDGHRGQGRGMTQPFIDLQIAQLATDSDEKIAPLERKRQRLLSKIPFLK